MTGRPRTPLAERLWTMVDRSAGPDACWPWVGGTNHHGYAEIRLGGARSRKLRAHRVAYEVTVGPIPDGLTIDHLCRNRRCCNPRHMEPVTQSENTRRGPAAPKAAQSHCIHGHAFTDANTYRRPNGTRACRRCLAERARAAYRPQRRIA